MNLYRLFPFLNWPRLEGPLWRSELMAGLTVALIMIPQAVAYAALAGMPLVTGLYAAMLPPLLAVLFGASTLISIGPTALTCLLVSASLTGLAPAGSEQWVVMAIWLALLSGFIQLMLGWMRYGWVLNLISSPVLMGFTQAAALLIIASQLPALVGSKASFTDWLYSPGFHPLALSFGSGSLLLFLFARRFFPRLPMTLIVVAGACALSMVSNFSNNADLVIGFLPAGLPALSLPAWPGVSTLLILLVPAMIIALVSFLETTSCARTQAQRTGALWNDNQDLIAQGLAKFASALSGSFPTSTSFGRSALNSFAGARSGWASVFMVVFVVLALLFLTPLLAHIPRAVLASVVIAAVSNLLDPKAIVTLWRSSRIEAITALATFVVTLLTAPRIHWGVLAGVIISLAHFLYQHLHPRIIEIGLHPDGSLRDRHLWKLPPLAPNLYALRMDDELDFASASVLERNILEHLAAHPDVRHVCLFAQPINRIDVTGIQTVERLCATLFQRQVHLHISGIKLPVETMLRKSGALQEHPMLHMYRVDSDTLAGLAAVCTKQD